MRILTTLLLFSLATLAVKAQVQNMVVHKADGSIVRYDVAGVDSTFEQSPKWSLRKFRSRQRKH